MSDLTVYRGSTLSHSERARLADQLARIDGIGDVVATMFEQASVIHGYALWRVAQTLRDAEHRRQLRMYASTFGDNEAFRQRTQAYLNEAVEIVALADVALLYELERFVARQENGVRLTASRPHYLDEHVK